MQDISQALASAFQLHQAGRLGEAERLYRDILARHPTHPDALHLLGALALQQNRAAEAVDLISRALDVAPNNAVYLTYLGNAYAALRQWDQAADSLRRAVAADPNSADAYFQLGMVESNQGQLERAAASFERAVAINPARPEAHFNLGNTWKDLERFDAAERCYREALRRRPGYVSALNNLGNVLREQDQLDEAVAMCRQAIGLQPNYARGYNSLGCALRDQRRFGEALACFSQALAINPDYALAHSNRGGVLHVLGRFDEAMVCYERALQLDPQLADAHHNRALVLLSRGDYQAGWPEYEWRWKCKHFVPFAGPQPRWDGSLLEGRTILIQIEQGMGDTLQFIRYVPLVRERGGRVLLQCHRPLERILEGYPGVDAIVPVGAPLPEFDVYAPLVSLPGIFGTTLETIPNQAPYLTADPQLIEHWRRRLEKFAGFKIGIAWQGNPKYTFDRIRSMRLAAFQPLAEVPGVRLFSLQKGPGTEQIVAATEQVPLVDLDPELDQVAGAFMDTAAVMKNLDLVITPDTATAHLAGALGVPVWIALPLNADWRWLIDRADSPWYPTARLFRQETLGAWDDVIRRMAAAVSPLAAR